MKVKCCSDHPWAHAISDVKAANSRIDIKCVRLKPSTESPIPPSSSGGVLSPLPVPSSRMCEASPASPHPASSLGKRSRDAGVEDSVVGACENVAQTLPDLVSPQPIPNLVPQDRNHQPRSNFHGYPCPHCGAGVGFNAKRCKECSRPCSYKTMRGSCSMHLTSSSIRPKKRLPTRKNAQVPALISLKGDVVPPHSEGNPNIVPNVQSRLGTQRSTRSSHIRNPQPQPLREPHLECSTPLQANGVSNKTLFDHVAMLRTEPVLRVARPILQRIMAHNLNRGLFNEPVDAVALGLPDYHRIVKRPMDFGTMKDQLYALHYERLEQFIADVRLVLSNAMVYNPSTNQVHINARQLLEEFEDELGKLGKKISRDTKRRAQHNCGVCQGRTCRLCGEKCLKLDPVMLICSGPCALRIK
mmetsp:Transcript_32645/g.44174  ORF Transcript_32645/g.44174 Transcript_32645/m.44174 type:complete len:414 (-) Transcript_32645:10-1251(-)